MNNWIGVPLLAILTAAWSDPVAAQQPEKLRRIGYLALAEGPSEREEILNRGLRELGWVDGQNLRIEYRWARGKVDRLPFLAEELVRLNVNLIIARGTPVVQAAKNATRSIPIVIGQSADPVATGFVASLAQPGGNITGMSMMAPELAVKRFELLRDIIPGLSRVAFLAHGRDPAHRVFLNEAVTAGQKLGINVQQLVVKGPEEFNSVFVTMIREGAGALIVQPIFINALGQGRRLADLAIKHHLPAISDGTPFAEVGGLINYGPDPADVWRHVAMSIKS